MQALVDGFDVSATQVAEEINSSGAACLTAVLTDEWLRAARECVESYLPLRGRRELYIQKDGAAEHAFVQRLVIDPRLEALLESVAHTGFPALDVRKERIDSAIRILVGSDPGDKPMWFHYDYSVVTMVIPIVIPNVGSHVSGELVLCPNRRPYRRFVLSNVIEKLVAQNVLYHKRFVRNLDQRQDTTVIALQPGNAYLFWGYRTYHATFPCADDALRVTLMLHYGDVHRGNRLLAGAKWLYRSICELRPARNKTRYVIAE